MKKKIIFAVATGLFAVATVFNMNVIQSNSAGDVSLDAIAVMAQAQNGETYINCTNCYVQPVTCRPSGITTHRCELGGNGCDVGGQIPC